MLVLDHDVCSEQEIKKSRFLTYLRRCTSEEQAREFYKEIRKLHPSAAHHCTAMKIGSLTRSSDDGEPSGTAGRPMLDVLAGCEADQIAAVVVRYFGGTLLGTGGLVRAYSSGVRQALQKASFREMRQMGYYQLCCPYDLCSKVESFLRQSDAVLQSCDYQESAVYYFLSAEDPNPRLSCISSGRLHANFLKTIENPV